MTILTAMEAGDGATAENVRTVEQTVERLKDMFSQSSTFNRDKEHIMCV